MINYLKGQLISVGKSFTNRIILVLKVNQIDHEILDHFFQSLALRNQLNDSNMGSIILLKISRSPNN